MEAVTVSLIMGVMETDMEDTDTAVEAPEDMEATDTKTVSISPLFLC